MDRRRRNDLHNLEAYVRALELYRLLRRIVAAFPPGEADLRKHLRCSSRSVLLNPGEGVGKRGGARIAAYYVALGEVKEVIVGLDCVEADELAPLQDVIPAQDLADRVAAMLSKLVESEEKRCGGRGTDPDPR